MIINLRKLVFLPTNSPLVLLNLFLNIMVKSLTVCLFVCLFVSVLGWCPLMRRVRAAYLLGGQMGVIIPFPNMHLLQERNPEPTSRQKALMRTLMDQSDTPAQDTYNWPQALSCFH